MCPASPPGEARKQDHMSDIKLKIDQPSIDAATQDSNLEKMETTRPAVTQAEADKHESDSDLETKMDTMNPSQPLKKEEKQNSKAITEMKMDEPPIKKVKQDSNSDMETKIDITRPSPPVAEKKVFTFDLELKTDVKCLVQTSMEKVMQATNSDKETKMDITRPSTPVAEKKDSASDLELKTDTTRPSSPVAEKIDSATDSESKTEESTSSTNEADNEDSASGPGPWRLRSFYLEDDSVSDYRDFMGREEYMDPLSSDEERFIAAAHKVRMNGQHDSHRSREDDSNDDETSDSDDSANSENLRYVVTDYTHSIVTYEDSMDSAVDERDLVDESVYHYAVNVRVVDDCLVEIEFDEPSQAEMDSNFSLLNRGRSSNN